MDITLYTIVGILLIGALYFYFKGRRERGVSPGKKGRISKTANLTTIGGQFSSGEWGELEGANRSL